LLFGRCSEIQMLSFEIILIFSLLDDVLLLD
jgi:hypothetical protein